MFSLVATVVQTGILLSEGANQKKLTIDPGQ